MSESTEGPEEEEEAQPWEELEGILDDFVEELRAIRQAFPMLLGSSLGMALAQYSAVWEGLGGRNSPFYRPYGDDADNRGIDYELTDRGIRVQTPAGFLDLPGSFRQLMHPLHAAESQYFSLQRLLPRTAIVTLVSEYDVLVGRLALFVLRHDPRALKSSDRSISLAELLGYSSIEDAQDAVLTKEVETLLRKSHTEQLEWFAKKLKLSVAPRKELLARMVEVTQRRHLYVHANAKVSAQYRTVCQQHQVEGVSRLEIGQELLADGPYIEAAADTMSEVGLILGQTVWRKLFPTAALAADEQILGCTEECGVSGQNALGANLAAYAIALPPGARPKRTRDTLLQLTLRLAASQRANGDVQACDKTLAVEDWTGLAPIYTVQHKALSGDLDGATSELRSMGPDGELDASDLRDDPIFADLRAHKGFRELFKSWHGEPVSTAVEVDAQRMKPAMHTLMDWVVEALTPDSEE